MSQERIHVLVVDPIFPAIDTIKGQTWYVYCCIIQRVIATIGEHIWKRLRRLGTSFERILTGRCLKLLWKILPAFSILIVVIFIHLETFEGRVPRTIVRYLSFCSRPLERRQWAGRKHFVFVPWRNQVMTTGRLRGVKLCAVTHSVFISCSFSWPTDVWQNSIPHKERMRTIYNESKARCNGS